MADVEDEIDIQIADEKLPDTEIVVEAEPEAAPKPEAPAVEDSIEELKANVERERQARIAAEQRADSMTNVAVQKTNETAESQLNLVTNAIGTLKAAQGTLRDNLSAAMANQDFDTAADIQVQISENAATLQTLESGKSQMEAQPKAQMQPQGDPVEAAAREVARTAPRAAEWIRGHPDYVRDPRLNSMMLAAHNLAVGKGHAIDSDSYFEDVERTLGLRQQPTAESPMSDAATQTGGAGNRRPPAPPAAPVSRSGDGTGGGSPNRVTLSAEERDAAASMGMSEREYAIQKLALIKEGKLTRH